MMPVECEFEAEVLAAVVQSRWPERTDAALREHVSKCALCADVAAVSAALDGAAQPLRDVAALPDAGRVWWLAQMRARREAARTAGRPITAAQVLAFACAMGLFGACFGATSTWFQNALRGLGSAVDWKMLLALSGAAMAHHAALTVLLLALVLLIPGAVYWAVARD